VKQHSNPFDDYYFFYFIVCVRACAQEELGVLGLQEILGSEPRGRLDMNPSDYP